MPDSLKLRIKLEHQPSSTRAKIAPNRVAKLRKTSFINAKSLVLLGITSLAGLGWLLNQSELASPISLNHAVASDAAEQTRERKKEDVVLPENVPIAPLVETIHVQPDIVDETPAKGEHREIDISEAMEIQQEQAELNLQPTKLPQLNTHIKRAQFTSAIRQREPIDQLPKTLYAVEDITRLYYFTEIRNMRGHTVSHQWEYEGKVMAKINFQIGGDHWRTYSSKYLNRKMFGSWQVIVSDEAGSVLHTESFTYHPLGDAVTLR